MIGAGAPEGFRSGFASIVGRPTVGKSTLLNQMMRRKVAITSPRAQTTRNAIRGVVNTDAAQVVFVDTPGLHRPRTILGEALNNVVHRTLRDMDAVVFVLDASQRIGPGDAFLARELIAAQARVVPALSKADLVSEHQLARQAERVGALGAFEPVLGVSGRTGAGVDRLIETVIGLLEPGPMYYPPGMVTDQPERVVIAELIREKALELTREEVPHSIAVVVEEMERIGEGLVEIDAILFVERDSQKGIVLGRRGAMIKEIGSRARSDIESLLGSDIYLRLRVKVEKDWQRRRELVARFGYGVV